MLITSKILVFAAGFSRTINKAAMKPMTRNNNPFTLIQMGLVSSFITRIATCKFRYEASLCSSGGEWRGEEAPSFSSNSFDRRNPCTARPKTLDFGLWTLDFGRPSNSYSFCSLFLLLTAATLCLTGCASPAHKLGSSRLAAVVIKDTSPDTIKASAKEVFDKHGFDNEPEDDNDLVFQKKASGAHSVLYGDWFSGPVTARAKLYLSDLRPGETLLDCDLYMVQEADDPLFAKERKVHASRGEFQSLLEEIKTKAESRK